MTDIHIRHCRIEARASPESGLGWAGAEAGRAFAGRVQTLVLSMLDQMLAPYLARLEPAEIPDALVLDLKLAATDLAGAAPLARSHLRDRVHDAIAKAIAHRFEIGSGGREGEGEGEAGCEVKAGGSAAQPMPAVATPASLLELLLEWHRDRQLEYRSALLSNDALLVLIESIMAELAGQQGTAPDAAGDHPVRLASPDALPRAPGVTDKALRQVLHALVAAAVDAADQVANSEAAVRLHQAIAAATQVVRSTRQGLAHRVRGRPESPVPDRKRSAAGPIDVSMEEDPREPASNRVVGLAKPLHAASPKRAAATPRPRRSHEWTPLPEGRYQLESALPFLALQPLSRHGILTAMAALQDHCGVAALAFAVALRTQGLPARTGWSAAQLGDAARLAGLSEPLDGAGLHSAARGSGVICEMAAGCVAGTLIAGHRAGLPLLLMGDGGKLVVFENEGFYPLCRLDGSRIAEVLGDIDEVFYVAEPDSILLAALDTAGLGAVAPGAPIRGERWRAAAAPNWRGMTNMARQRFSTVAPRLAGTDRAARRAIEVWHGLTAERPVLAETAQTADALDFDRAASLLAGFALADIAWILFGRNPAAWVDPDPLLAVERFGDLSATLDVTFREVTVSLPLGSRFTNLRDAGLLDTIHDAPWWPGRIVSFSCG